MRGKQYVIEYLCPYCDHKVSFKEEDVVAPHEAYCWNCDHDLMKDDLVEYKKPLSVKKSLTKAQIRAILNT